MVDEKKIKNPMKEVKLYLWLVVLVIIGTSYCLAAMVGNFLLGSVTAK